jgi:hypothetical protein
LVLDPDRSLPGNFHSISFTRPVDAPASPPGDRYSLFGYYIIFTLGEGFLLLHLNWFPADWALLAISPDLLFLGFAIAWFASPILNPGKERNQINLEVFLFPLAPALIEPGPVF